MKKHLIRLLIIILTFTAFSVSSATAAPGSGYSELIVDASNGNIIHQLNSDKMRYPASLTKMMTLYLTFEALENKKLKMNQPLRASRHAASQPPMGMGFRTGQTITVREAVLSLIVKSANDAAVVLGEAVGKTESQFGQMMTAKARALGMSKTSFANASGLHSPRQYTTARDMAKLVIALQKDFPQYYPLFSRTSFNYRGRIYLGHNRITRDYQGADGVKTGYVRVSGYNLASSAVRGGKRLVGVVLGGKTSLARDRRMANLLDSSFSKFRIAENTIENKPAKRTIKKYKKRKATAQKKKSSLLAIKEVA